MTDSPVTIRAAQDGTTEDGPPKSRESVGLMLVTHRGVGSELLATAAATLGICPLQTRCLEVQEYDDPDLLIGRGRQLADEIDRGDGLLILTDACGSTPANIALGIAEGRRIRVLGGLNLPMLLRVYNYAGLSLEALAEAALVGGRTGVAAADREEPA